MKVSKKLLFLTLLVTGTSWAALDRRYPTSPVTDVRWDSYNDCLFTIVKATVTFDLDKWMVLGDTDPQFSLLGNNQVVYLYEIYDVANQVDKGSAKVSVEFDKNDTINRWIALPKLVSSGTLPSGESYSTFDNLDSTNTFIYFSSMTLQDYTKYIIWQTKIQLLQQIAHDDMEEYMVWSDTDLYKADGKTVDPNKFPPIDAFTGKAEWAGWCESIINNHLVPVACPQ